MYESQRIYCDGCSFPNPGQTGAGIVIPNVIEIGRYLGEGSNQTAELYAMREALLRARPEDLILSDSMYAVNLTIGRWRPKVHKELVRELRKLLKPGVTVKWVSGHAGDTWQERADKLAKRATIKRINFENILSVGV